MTRFVVVLNYNNQGTRVFGPYRTFKAAEGDANAMDSKYAAYVLPIEEPKELP